MYSGFDLFTGSGTIGGLFANAFSFALSVWPLWVGPILVYILIKVYMDYAEDRFRDRMRAGAVLLEIKFPQEVLKSPMAMEVVIQGLWHTNGETNWYKMHFEGSRRPWFALELVSLGGKIHFYIWAFGNMKGYLESYVYSQYPGAEVVLAEDYTKKIGYDKGVTDMWCCEFELVKPSPVPVKSYLDYGLDKSDLEDENRVDPLLQQLEYLGQIGPNEQVWVQYVIKSHKAEKLVKMDGKDKKGNKIKVWKKVDWAYDAKLEIDRMKKLVEPKVEGGAPGRHTKGELEYMYAMERSLNKNAFDTRIRVIYIAPVANFNAGYGASLAGLMTPFGAGNFNGLRPCKGMKKFNYPWEETEREKDKEKRKHLAGYRNRSYGYPPFKKGDKPFVMNTETLATLFHVPGSPGLNPAIDRVASKKSEAPANLPI